MMAGGWTCQCWTVEGDALGDANVSGRIRRGQIDDPLTDVLRDGAAPEGEIHCLPGLRPLIFAPKLALPRAIQGANIDG